MRDLPGTMGISKALAENDTVAQGSLERLV
jgi:hypothetical protein